MSANMKVTTGVSVKASGAVVLHDVTIGYVFKNVDRLEPWESYYMNEEYPFYYATRKQAVESLVRLYTNN